MMEPVELICQFCDKKFSRETSLLRHIKNIHKVSHVEDPPVAVNEAQSTSSTSTTLQWTPVLKDGTLSILIVYDLEKEKTELAEALISIETRLNIRVHLAKSLPLPETNHQSSREFNYIIFLLDITRRHSFRVFEAAVKLIDIQFFLGRSFFISINMSVLDKACCHVDYLREIQNIYKTKVFHGNFSNEEKIHHMASVVLEHIKKAFAP